MSATYSLTDMVSQTDFAGHTHTASYTGVGLLAETDTTMADGGVISTTTSYAPDKQALATGYEGTRQNTMGYDAIGRAKTRGSRGRREER